MFFFKRMDILLNHNKITLSSNIKLEGLRKQNNADWWQHIVDFLEQWANNSPEVEVFTSGSTGEAKKIKLQKAHLWQSAKQTCDFFKLNDKANALLCLPTRYIAGKMMLVRAMVAQMNLICIEPSANPIKKLKESVDFAAMVPMQVYQGVEEIEKLNKINNLIIGGGKVSDELVRKLSLFSGKVFETFGMTETLSHIAIKQISPKKENFFTPLSGVKITQAEDKTLIIDCPKIGVNQLKTNDIVEMYNKKGAFNWLGRTDFLINSGGIKVIPELIEKKIQQYISSVFLIAGKSDEQFGEKLVLLIEQTDKKNDTTELMEKIKKVLPQKFLPREIIFVEKIPLTLSGKINRTKIIDICNLS